MNELMKKQGKRLKGVRQIMGLSQAKFCNWLAEHNKLGNFQEIYSIKTIQAWEQGVRKVPDNIKKVLSDNVTIDGQLVQYAYLNGDTDFITQSTGTIIQHSAETLKSFNSSNVEQPGWKQATVSDIEKMADVPLNRFGQVFLNDILPIYNYTTNDFFDIVRFNSCMYKKIGLLIEEYLREERHGR